MKTTVCCAYVLVTKEGFVSLECVALTLAVTFRATAREILQGHISDSGSVCGATIQRIGMCVCRKLPWSLPNVSYYALTGEPVHPRFVLG